MSQSHGHHQEVKNRDVKKMGNKGNEMERKKRSKKGAVKERRKKKRNQRIAATSEAMVKFPEGVVVSVLFLPYLAIFSSSRSLGSTSKLRSYIS